MFSQIGWRGGQVLQACWLQACRLLYSHLIAFRVDLHCGQLCKEAPRKCLGRSQQTKLDIFNAQSNDQHDYSH